MADQPKPIDTKWRSRAPHSGFELNTGGLELSVTDQRERGAGWVWHVGADYEYAEGGDLQRAGGYDTADEAKRAACAWARSFCEKTLGAIASAEAA